MASSLDLRMRGLLATRVGFHHGLLGVSLLGLVLGLACTPRPSEQECEQLGRHVVELARAAHEGRASEIAEAVANEHATKLRDRCIEEGTSREVACVLAAESLERVQDCAPTR